MPILFIRRSPPRGNLPPVNITSIWHSALNRRRSKSADGSNSKGWNCIKVKDFYRTSENFFGSASYILMAVHWGFGLF